MLCSAFRQHVTTVEHALDHPRESLPEPSRAFQFDDLIADLAREHPEHDLETIMCEARAAFIHGQARPAEQDAADEWDAHFRKKSD